MAREMKDSGIEWIGEIPKHWSIKKMKYLVEFVQDKAQEQDSIKQYIALENIESWTGKYIETENTYGTEGALLCNKDDVIFGKLRPYLAKTMLINKDSVCSSEFAVMKGNGLIPRFLNYLARSDHFISVVNAGAYGTKMPRANIDQIGNLYFPVPPSFEQEMLSSFLDSKCAEIDKAIEATKASIEEYRKLRQAIITEAVTKGLDPDVEMKDSGIEWIGEIPISWTINTLGRLSSSMRNGYVGPTKEILRESGVRYIQSLHVKDGQILYSDDFYVSEEWGNNHPKIHTNDILIVQTGDIGQVGLVTNDYNECNCHALIICTPKQTIISSAYLCYYFRSSFGLRQLKQFETGATLKHLNSGDIKFSKVILPSLDEQIEICSYLDSKCSEIDSLIKSKEKLIEELTAYRKSLIFEYVTGKKEVPAV